MIGRILVGLFAINKHKAIIYFTYYEFMLFLLLLSTLLVKFFYVYEENMWWFYSEEYAKYIKKTKHLVPFVF